VESGSQEHEMKKNKRRNSERWISTRVAWRIGTGQKRTTCEKRRGRKIKKILAGDEKNRLAQYLHTDRGEGRGGTGINPKGRMRTGHRVAAPREKKGTTQGSAQVGNVEKKGMESKLEEINRKVLAIGEKYQNKSQAPVENQEWGGTTLEENKEGMKGLYAQKKQKKKKSTVETTPCHPKKERVNFQGQGPMVRTKRVKRPHRRNSAIGGKETSARVAESAPKKASLPHTKQNENCIKKEKKGDARNI